MQNVLKQSELVDQLTRFAIDSAQAAELCAETFRETLSYLEAHLVAQASTLNREDLARIVALTALCNASITSLSYVKKTHYKRVDRTLERVRAEVLQ